MMKCCGPAWVLLLLAGCRKQDANQRFSTLSDEFVHTTLSFSPVTAAAAGLHKYQGRNLDELLDEVSPASFDRQRKFYTQFRRRLAEQAPVDQLDEQSKVDSRMIESQVGLALLELDETQPFLHNPTMYVELAGNAIFSPLVLEYAPKPERIRHIIARLKQFPLFFDYARSNLTSSPDIWTHVAAEENEGNIRLVNQTVRAAVPSELRAEFDRVATPALDALRQFQNYLQNSLSKRNDADWRLGRPKYEKKFRYALATGQEPDDVLQRAETDLEKVRQTMLEIASPIHRSMGHGDHAGLEPGDRANRIISEVLARIAEKHPAREKFMDEARRDLDEVRAFAQGKALLTLPSRSNLQVIDTPEFMRGIYSVAGFAPAPALEPQLGAFYWVTPIPQDWPLQRVESKLREYNTYSLKLITIHEAMPGHYVQFEFANDVQPPFRRLLRSVFGNGPYIEGWAQFATGIVLEAGYLDHSPELRLTFLKQQLRAIANTILDVRLQMLDMTDQEALDLMEKQAFQETQEAEAKLQRAKLSSVQLPTYYVGWNGWVAAREQYQRQQGGSFSLKDFNDRSLRQGAIPLPSLVPLISAAPGGTQSR